MIVPANFHDCCKNIRVLNRYASFTDWKFYARLTDNHVHLIAVDLRDHSEYEVMRKYHSNFIDFITDIQILKNTLLRMECNDICRCPQKSQRFKYSKLWKALKERKLSKS